MDSFYDNYLMGVLVMMVLSMALMTVVIPVSAHVTLIWLYGDTFTCGGATMWKELLHNTCYHSPEYDGYMYSVFTTC